MHSARAGLTSAVALFAGVYLSAMFINSTWSGLRPYRMTKEQFAATVLTKDEMPVTVIGFDGPHAVDAENGEDISYTPLFPSTYSDTACALTSEVEADSRAFTGFHLDSDEIGTVPESAQRSIVRTRILSGEDKYAGVDRAVSSLGSALACASREDVDLANPEVKWLSGDRYGYLYNSDQGYFSQLVDFKSAGNTGLIVEGYNVTPQSFDTIVDAQIDKIREVKKNENTFLHPWVPAPWTLIPACTPGSKKTASSPIPHLS